MKVLPYHYPKSNTYYNRLIVEPVQLPEVILPNGLRVPAQELPGSQLGIVYQACEGSDFHPGDEVQYMKMDRAVNEEMDTINVEGKVYDVVYEPKIWAHNDKPYNKIFVEHLTDSQALESGLIIPSNVQSVTRKGVIYDAPEYFNLKKGDRIEYQNQLDGHYPIATIDGVNYDVIYESDIFTVNEQVAPFRIIVKVDLAAQHIKRSSTHSGLKLSPLFIHMLRNLQYAEISDIGENAMKMYPELKRGDTAIIDHAIESQAYRVLRFEIGKNNTPTFEYRIINCYDFSDREILGKLHYNKETKKIIDITPLGGSVFMKWDFNFFEGENKVGQSYLVDPASKLSNYHNLSDLKNVVSHLRAEAAETAKLKMAGIKQMISGTDPEKQPDQHAFLMKEAALIQRDETIKAAALHKDHWVVCDSIYKRQVPRYVISPYEVLYPINLLGQKFLIGHSDFLLFNSHTNMNITSKDLVALSDNVIVLPIEEKQKEGKLVIPESARSKPQYGTVIKVASDNPIGVKEGDFILFRQGAGLVQQIDNVDHRIMKQNDLLAILPAQE